MTGRGAAAVRPRSPLLCIDPVDEAGPLARAHLLDEVGVSVRSCDRLINDTAPPRMRGPPAPTRFDVRSTPSMPGGVTDAVLVINETAAFLFHVRTLPPVRWSGSGTGTDSSPAPAKRVMARSSHPSDISEVVQDTTSQFSAGLDRVWSADWWRDGLGDDRWLR